MSGKMTFHVPKRTWISVRHITVSLVLVCSQQHKLKRQCDMKNEDITLYTNEVEQLASHPWESNWTITEMRRTHALFLWLCEYPCAPAFLPSHHQQLHVWILCWPCDAQTYVWTQDAQPLSPEYKPLRYFKWPLVSVWFLVPVVPGSFAATWWCSESKLPVKSGVSSPPLWTERAEASLVTQQLWQRSLMELREVCFLFAFTTEKSAEVAFLWALHPLPPSLCSSPLPLASGISRGKPGKLWLYCFFDPFTSSFYRTRMGTVKKCQPGPECCDTVVTSRGSEPFSKRGTKDQLCLLRVYQIFTCPKSKS